jgi:hypothetical protein
MLGNDIQSYDYIGFGVVFEDLLATPPVKLKALGASLYQARNNWNRVIEQWKPNDMPLKALYDTTNRLGIGILISQRYFCSRSLLQSGRRFGI